eukprot:CAMPEP_0202825774 /NCGR_PEP_ID=MMETSP1389-20130828/13220_1 /ASSEMBLY_ACC=CAM_ASM_000865 /TAXON_ID=302021 /ORGANISM="Rhodomonas sp., Strain CCMP768" /LENGTH=60 /DNA_ID=CAMNT_0049499021 /DNA_START=126 /DNA_END=304 /DNA_ORIENTATION=-
MTASAELSGLCDHSWHSFTALRPLLTSVGRSRCSFATLLAMDSASSTNAFTDVSDSSLAT